MGVVETTSSPEAHPRKTSPEPRGDAPPATLGDVLYAGKSKALVAEAEWVALVHSVAAGEHAALHGLYDRAHRLVFTLIMRITLNRETAEELTLDVFHDVWRRAGLYDPANGTVLGWIMNQARSRALDRLRFDRRKKRVHANGDDSAAADAPDPHQVVAWREQSQALRCALAVLTSDERSAIEAAFFSEMTYAEVALHLNQPLGTVKSRIRSGLHKLRRALAEKAGTP